jgi:glycosyltransferase involved in cell wall biosynthesis
MEKPLVSVIMPTYKQPQYLPTSVLGVMTQTYLNLELIVVPVVDDEQTMGGLKELQHMFPAFIVAASDRASIVHQINVGLGKAHGTYVTLIASDDFMLPGKIADEVNVAHMRNALLVYSLFFYGDDNLTITGGVTTQSVPVFSYDTLICRNYITDNALVHRSMYDEFGPFDESLEILAVYDKWLHIAEKHPTHIVRNPVPTFIYRQHGDQAHEKRIAMQEKDRFELYRRVVSSSLQRMGRDVKPEDVNFRVTQI